MAKNLADSWEMGENLANSWDSSTPNPDPNIWINS